MYLTAQKRYETGNMNFSALYGLEGLSYVYGRMGETIRQNLRAFRLSQE